MLFFWALCCLVSEVSSISVCGNADNYLTVFFSKGCFVKPMPTSPSFIFVHVDGLHFSKAKHDINEYTGLQMNKKIFDFEQEFIQTSVHEDHTHNIHLQTFTAPYLQKLTLSNIHLLQWDVVELFGTKEKRGKLQHLILRNVAIESFQPRVQLIDGLIHQLSWLEELHLNAVRVGEDAGHPPHLRQRKLLVEEQQQANKLKKIVLSNNALLSLPKSVLHLNELTMLDLSGNKLMQFPNEVLKLTNLKSLKLKGNEGMVVKVKSEEELKRLSKLAVEFPENTSIGDCLDAKEVDVNGKKVSVCLDLSVPTTPPPTTLSPTPSNARMPISPTATNGIKKKDSFEENSKTKTSGEGASSKANVYVIVCIAVGGLIIIVLICVMIIVQKRRKEKEIEIRRRYQPQITPSSSQKILEVPRSFNLEFLQSDEELKELILNDSDVTCIRQLNYSALWSAEYEQTKVVVQKVQRGSPQVIEKFVSDLRMMVQFHHHSITNFLGFTCGSSRELATIVEYMENGTLRSVLAKKSIDLGVVQRLHMAMDIASALEYLQNNFDKIYGDLRSQKILVNSVFVCKLNLYYCVNDTKQCEEEKEREAVVKYGVGKMAWLAPEVLTGGKLSQKTDVFALGVIMCELTNRELPYSKLIQEHGNAGADIIIHKKITNHDLEIPFRPEIGICPVFFRKLISSCWATDPMDRPTMTEVLSILKENLKNQPIRNSGTLNK